MTSWGWRECTNNIASPLKYEVDVQICQNAIGPAKFDFEFFVFTQGVAWFLIPATCRSKATTRPPGGPTPVRLKAKFGSEKSP